MRPNHLDFGAVEGTEKFSRPGAILRDPETDVFEDGPQLHIHKKLKKGFKKITTGIKSALPLVAGAGGGLLNTIIPGAGSIVQGFLTQGAETLEQVGQQQAAGGIGEVVSNLLGVREALFPKEAEENQQIIQQQIGKVPRTAPSPLRAVGVGAFLALGAAGVGLLVGGPIGAGIGLAVGGGGAALGGADAVDRLIFGMK